ncbi:MAG: hypothetical protein AAFV59_17270, partial [Pseudomonadota bacterium]
MMLAVLIKRSPKRMSLIALAVALAAANASSQAQSSDATIDQVQLQDVWSDMDVHVDDYAWEASSTSTAVGNAAAGLVMSGDVTVQSHQVQDGSVTADNQLTGGSAGLAVATTTAYGNSTTGGTWSGNTYYR